MIDPTLSLAFSMHSAKGVYAVLLGSGVSRAAGIKTGWEITLDLIRRLAAACNEDCGDNPEAWYEGKYGEKTDYSKILAELGRAEGNRRDILRRYFEPDGESDEGRKRPTTAHQRIAQLVKAGYIRVILTTNFDRLMEQALEAEGVHPTVIRKHQDIRGAKPLQHEQCTIVKLHGDYLDTEIRNTEAELSHYHREMDRLLDRVFDEYGLAICGWSAEYDHALRDALRRNANRRYARYWTCRDEIGERSAEMINYLDAVTILIEEADQFFSTLADQVLALEEVDRQHPLTAEAAAVRLRSLMADRDIIRIEHMLSEEVGSLLNRLDSDMSVDPHEYLSADGLRTNMARSSAMAEVLCSLFSTGYYYRLDHEQGPWARSIATMGFPRSTEETRLHRYLMLFPAILCFYSAGISALAKGRYDTLQELFWSSPMDAAVGSRGRISCLAPTWWVWWMDRFRNALADVRDHEMESRNPVNMKQLAYDAHEHIYLAVRRPLQGFIPFDEKYTEWFDRFEYLAGMVSMFQDSVRDKSNDGNWRVGPPLGLYALRGSTSYDALPVVRYFAETISKNEGDSPLLRVFGDQFTGEDLQRIRQSYDALAQRGYLTWNRHI